MEVKVTLKIVNILIFIFSNFVLISHNFFTTFFFSFSIIFWLNFFLEHIYFSPLPLWAQITKTSANLKTTIFLTCKFEDLKIDESVRIINALCWLKKMLSEKLEFWNYFDSFWLFCWSSMSIFVTINLFFKLQFKAYFTFKNYFIQKLKNNYYSTKLWLQILNYLFIEIRCLALQN